MEAVDSDSWIDNIDIQALLSPAEFNEDHSDMANDSHASSSSPIHSSNSHVPYHQGTLHIPDAPQFTHLDSNALPSQSHQSLTPSSNFIAPINSYNRPFPQSDLSSFYPTHTANPIASHSHANKFQHSSANIVHDPHFIQSMHSPFDPTVTFSHNIASHSVHFHPHSFQSNMNIAHYPDFSQSTQHSVYHTNPHPLPPYSHSYPIPQPNYSCYQNSQLDFALHDGSVDNNFFMNNAAFVSPTVHNTHSTSTSNAANSFAGTSKVTSSTSHFNAHDSVQDGSSTSQQVTRAVYKKQKGKTSQACRIFPQILPDDKTRNTKQNTGKYQLWYFILKLLGDVSYKSIIVWTGDKRNFRVKDTERLCELWSKHNGRTDAVKWDTLQRTIRSCGENGLLMALPSKSHKGRNEEGLFGYVIEPSFYLKMTRSELDQFINANCEMNDISHRYCPY